MYVGQEHDLAYVPTKTKKCSVSCKTERFKPEGPFYHVLDGH